jgi:outer membrane protein OmpA-like peptidoglycan-associated protein
VKTPTMNPAPREHPLPRGEPLTQNDSDPEDPMNAVKLNGPTSHGPKTFLHPRPEGATRRIVLGLSALTLAVAVTTGCSWSNQTKGTIVGTGTGAAAGAAVGSQTGSTVRGAIIGAAVGGAAGMIIGNQMDKHAEELEYALPGAHVQRIGEGIAVTFPDGLLFPFDSDQLRPEARENLIRFAASLAQYPNTTVLVVGHTDSDGAASYNQLLSERRARSAADFIALQGLARARLNTVGAGENEPIATNSTAAGKSQNRRVEVAIFAAS